MHARGDGHTALFSDTFNKITSFVFEYLLQVCLAILDRAI